MIYPGNSSPDRIVLGYLWVSIKNKNMKKLFFILIVFVISKPGEAQSSVAKPEILYGVIQKEDLMKPPFDTWFNPGYDNYSPDPLVKDKLKKLIAKKCQHPAFFRHLVR